MQLSEPFVVFVLRSVDGLVLVSQHIPPTDAALLPLDVMLPPPEAVVAVMSEIEFVDKTGNVAGSSFLQLKVNTNHKSINNAE